MRVLIRRQKNTLALWHWSQTLQKKVKPVVTGQIYYDYDVN